MTDRGKRGIKTMLLLAGSFGFAFLLGEMIHELGHFLAHRYFGTSGAAIHLDPFGGSRIYGVHALPLNQMGITTAAGPGLNLLAGSLITLSLWRQKRPGLLPLTLWGPVALIQEGVNLSLGLLSPGSDARWLAEWGMPAWLLVLLGAGFIILGTALISRLLSDGTISPERPFGERFPLVFFGLGFLMILRGVVSLFVSPAAAVENLVPLAFALLLSLVITGIQGAWRARLASLGDNPLSWRSSLLAVGMGVGMLLAQVLLP